MPTLLAELKTVIQIPFVLPNVLAIAEDMSKGEFAEMIMPDLIPCFAVTEPVQVMLILMQRMDLILEKASTVQVNSYALPMLYNALESASPQMQELCVKLLPTFAPIVEYAQLKNNILPRLLAVCLETNSLSLRINCLITMNKLLDLLDKWTVVERLMPTLEQIPSREPGVLMALLGVFDSLVKHKKLQLEKSVIATRVLPFLFPLLVEDSLNAQQFRTWMSVLKNMVTVVEKDRIHKLEEIAGIREQTSQLDISGDGASVTRDPLSAAKAAQLKDDDFDKMEALIESESRLAKHAQGPGGLLDMELGDGGGGPPAAGDLMGSGTPAMMPTTGSGASAPAPAAAGGMGGGAPESAAAAPASSSSPPAPSADDNELMKMLEDMVPTGWGGDSGKSGACERLGGGRPVRARAGLGLRLVALCSSERLDALTVLLSCSGFARARSV